MAKSTPDISVVVPVFDEEGAAPELAREIAAAFAGRDFEIVFVDDGSRDGTAEQLARSWGDDRLVLIERPFEGRGAGLNAAVAAARHDL